MNLPRSLVLVNYSLFVVTLLPLLAFNSFSVSGQDVVLGDVTENGTSSSSSSSSNSVTSSIVGYERVLMRRKRFLIFPKGAQISCTLSMVKALVFKGPRGYNMIAEVDYFYPLPDSVDALRPKRKKLKPATTAPPPTTTLPPPPVEHFAESFDYHDGNHIFHSPEFDHHPELFVPDSGWKNDPNLADLRDVPPGVEVPAKDRIWSAQSGKTQFDPTRLFRWPAPQRRLPVTDYWNRPPATPQQWTSNQDLRVSPQLQRIDYIPHGRAMRDTAMAENGRGVLTGTATSATRPPPPPAGTGNAETRRESKKDTDENHWMEHEDWEHFDAHRDRRDLYKSLEGVISGLNLQPCLLRTICEAQHFLLPKGKSLFHDIFKILFTLPVKKEFSDKYAEAMRRQPDDCHNMYVNECPISILNMFLTSERVI